MLGRQEGLGRGLMHLWYTGVYGIKGFCTFFLFIAYLLTNRLHTLGKSHARDRFGGVTTQKGGVTFSKSDTFSAPKAPKIFEK